MPVLAEGNNVLAAIAATEKNLEQALATGQTTSGRLENLHRTLDMECLEFCRFQELKTIAVAERKISLDEGNTIYRLLGGSPDTFNRQPLPVKIVLTQLFQAMLQRRLKPRRVDPVEELVSGLRKPRLPARAPKEPAGLTPEKLRKRGFSPSVTEAVFTWIRQNIGMDPDEERRTFRSVLSFKKTYGLAWWDVEWAVRYAIEDGLDLNEPEDWAVIVERLGLRPEDVQTLPLFGRRKR